MGTVRPCWERVPLTVTTALCLQRCHGRLVYIWFPLRLCLTTSRPHIWSSGRHWLSPSISSWLLSLPGELKGERESRSGGKRERKSATERTHHGIFPSFPPCSTLVWSDSSPARPKGELLPGLCIARYPCSSSHSPLTLLESYFSVNCHDLWRVTEDILSWSTWPISLLILWLVYIMELQLCSRLTWLVLICHFSHGSLSGLVKSFMADRYTLFHSQADTVQLFLSVWFDFYSTSPWVKH